MCDYDTFYCSKCGKSVNIPSEPDPMGKQLQCKECNNVYELNYARMFPPTRKMNRLILRKTGKRAQLSEQRSTARRKTIGNYHILKTLGRGGVGEVYYAFHSRSEKYVALKTIKESMRLSTTAEKRFLIEADTLQLLEHPNIVKFYSMGHAENSYYFAMEYIEGISFQEYIEKSPFDLSQVFKMTLQIIDALDYAHQKGVVHRDIKSSNIMMDKNDIPKLIDFGLVKLMQQSTRITAQGKMIGSYQYMSPEQLEGESEEVDQRTDIYSLGLIFYELLTKEHPIQASNLTQYITQIRSKIFTPPCEINDKVPQIVSDICLKAVAKAKENRYQKMSDFYEALKRVEKTIE